MNNLLLLSGVILLASCSDRKGCDCVQERWERVAEYTPSNSVVAATSWDKVGNTETIGTDDCSKNNTLGSEGVSSSTVLANGNTKKTEFQYRITCN